MPLLVFLLTNMAVGVLLFEWAWFQTARLRQQNEARDSLFPAWRRDDVKKWSRLSFYPGAVTILPLRFFCFVLILLVFYPVTRLIFIGVDISKKVP